LASKNLPWGRGGSTKAAGGQPTKGTVAWKISDDEGGKRQVGGSKRVKKRTSGWPQNGGNAIREFGESLEKRKREMQKRKLPPGTRGRCQKLTKKKRKSKLKQTARLGEGGEKKKKESRATKRKKKCPENKEGPRRDKRPLKVQRRTS